jgi:hypothetical protein
MKKTQSKRPKPQTQKAKTKHAKEAAAPPQPAFVGFVLGRMMMLNGYVVLHALRARSGDGTLTTHRKEFNRWKSKQAAWKWLKARPLLANLHVYSLEALDIAEETALPTY